VPIGVVDRTRTAVGGTIKMRIGISGRVLRKEAPTGVHKYTRSLLREVARHDVEVVVFGVDSVPQEIRAADCEAVGGDAAHSGITAHVWEQAVLPALAHRHDVDVLHAPAGLPPLISPVPTVLTVHDLAPIRHPEWFTGRYSTYYRAMTPLAIRSADALVAVSAFTRDELRAAYPAVDDKTTVVYNGVTTPPDGTPPEGVDDEFLVFVGSANRRKNLVRLLEAYDAYRASEKDPPELVVVGPDRDIFSELSLPESKGVRTLGYVSEETLGWLYRNATALVFPTLYEGFGFPILEAMSVGTPVVTSDRGAMREVADSAAVLVDPENPSAIAEGIDRVVRGRDEYSEQGRQRASAFDWERTAAETLEVYQQTAGER
jgi:glycosyltransferase involved in cell wall biosynthesis